MMSIVKSPIPKAAKAAPDQGGLKTGTRLGRFYDEVRKTADRLYPLTMAPTAPETLKSRYRYFLRSLVYWSSSMQWLEFLSGHEKLAALAKQLPWLVEKIHRPYFRADYSARQRLAHLREHYEFALRHPLGNALLQAPVQAIELVRFTGKDGTGYELFLSERERFRKEGELLLQIKRQGVSLFYLCFSFAGPVEKGCIRIGCLQGPRPALGAQVVKTLTKNTHGLLPHRLMLFAVQVLAEVYGVRLLLALGNQHHIYRSWRKRRPLPRDYDNLWLQLGGTEQRPGEYVMSLQTAFKSVEEYPSHKRAEAKRRLQLLDDIQQSIRIRLQCTVGID